MHTFVLQGSSFSKEQFIKKLITEQKILAFNIYSYEEALGLAQAKEIKRILASKAAGARLFAVYKQPTIEAQNALLKTLEEFEADSYFIFASGEELLPTVLSRCQIIKLDKVTKINNQEGGDATLLDKCVESYLNGRASECMSWIDSFFASEREDSWENIIVGLRQLMFTYLKKQEKQKLRAAYRLLSSLTESASLVHSNNVSARLISERIFVS